MSDEKARLAQHFRNRGMSAGNAERMSVEVINKHGEKHIHKVVDRLERKGRTENRKITRERIEVRGD